MKQINGKTFTSILIFHVLSVLEGVAIAILVYMKLSQ